ncbi:TadE/TadG family type IV pilus assembly protein [Xylanimonas protaetiae]|uniref:Pilus assembly protein n=1 Tax=Xylanimonas protaetiae TaxID=2509457 RepID=A0A4P6F0N9_9MICO|nr:TadE/TadG family type IV pilus assembly protein [Xylanimonas protaetiae]QAY68766.1 pilus assembly protein [Xylanimonas protaetiae]
MTRQPHLSVLRRAERESERGSATIEAAILVPAFGLLVLLVVLGGRIALAHQVVQSAAADAARAASLERTTTTAHNAATDAATLTLAGQQLDCAHVDVTVEATGFDAPPGAASTVTVTVSCAVDLADLTAIPGLPGTRTVEATMTSPIDRWRSQ